MVYGYLKFLIIIIIKRWLNLLTCLHQLCFCDIMMLHIVIGGSCLFITRAEMWIKNWEVELKCVNLPHEEPVKSFLYIWLFRVWSCVLIELVEVKIFLLKRFFVSLRTWQDLDFHGGQRPQFVLICVSVDKLCERPSFFFLPPSSSSKPQPPVTAASSSPPGGFVTYLFI